MNHAFVDGNKRVGHFAMETFLVLNGEQIEAPVDEQEQIILNSRRDGLIATRSPNGCART